MSQDPHSVGFADFVAVLIVETLDSIVAAHTSQEERMRALDEALDLSVEDFAATAISDDVLATALIQSFPDGKGGTALIVGGPVPPDSTLEELAVKLTGSDVEGIAPKQTLTARGVKRVTDALALHLASRQLAALREARGRGVPRVLVDGGTLKARVNFTTTRATAQPTTTPAGARSATGTPTRAMTSGPQPVLRTLTRPTDALAVGMVRFATPLRAGILESIHDLRLNVLTPRTDTPTPATDRADIQGEVEIRFRTLL
ncbi:MAG: hypothetical protein U0Q08_11275 [Dermatophilaceae bacterium]